MKTFDLKRVVPPPPPPVKICVACNAFRAECIVPVREASAPMCWLCAHHVVDHERDLHEAMTAECECLPHQIYPDREPPRHAGWCSGDDCTGGCVQRFPHGDVTREMIEKATPEELLRGSSLSDALAERAREVVANMTPKQRELLTNGCVTVGQMSERRAGASFTGVMKGLAPLRLWCDEEKPSRSRVCRCGVCGEEGHYAKTCPTVRRR